MPLVHFMNHKFLNGKKCTISWKYVSEKREVVVSLTPRLKEGRINYLSSLQKITCTRDLKKHKSLF